MEVKQAAAVQIREASEKEHFLKCWELVKQLRPQLNQDRYLTLMLYMLDEGYRLIYLEESGKLLSICGYRYTTRLDTGRSLSIDELYTHPEERGKGYAHTLFNHVVAGALEDELQSITLPARYNDHQVHRLCLKEGFRIEGMHFVKKLG